MKYENVADIYSANEKMRQYLTAAVSNISAEEATTLPEGEKWTLEQLVEHVAIVAGGMSRICAKLVGASKADGKVSDGSFSLSVNFNERAEVIAHTKVEAPERVAPTGRVTLEQSLEILKAATSDFESMRPDLERFDLSGHTFPHPFFGDLNAGEWLVMAGLHEGRHTKQIQAILARIRQ